MRSTFHAATFKPLHAFLVGSQLQLKPTLNVDTIALRDRHLGGVRVAFFLPFTPCAKRLETRVIRWIRNRLEIKWAQIPGIGYARVSSLDRNPDRQIAALRAEGCDRISAKTSGEDMRDRPELEKAMDALPTKGVLVLAEWDRATRSLMTASTSWSACRTAVPSLRSGSARARSHNASGRGILALLSGLAEEERTRVLRRANEGRIAAIKRGSRLGRNSSSTTIGGGSRQTPRSRRELPGDR